MQFQIIPGRIDLDQGVCEGNLASHMFEKFSPDAVKVMLIAVDEVYQLGNNYCGTEHVLIGLASVENAKPYQLLTKNGITKENISNVVYEIAGVDAANRKKTNMMLAFEGHRYYSPRCIRVLCMFEELESIHPEHLLLGIIKEADEIDKDGYAYRALTNLGLDFENLKRELAI